MFIIVKGAEEFGFEITKSLWDTINLANTLIHILSAYFVGELRLTAR